MVLGPDIHRRDVAFEFCAVNLEVEIVVDICDLPFRARARDGDKSFEQCGLNHKELDVLDPVGLAASQQVAEFLNLGRLVEIDSVLRIRGGSERKLDLSPIGTAHLNPEQGFPGNVVKPDGGFFWLKEALRKALPLPIAVGKRHHAGEEVLKGLVGVKRHLDAKTAKHAEIGMIEVDTKAVKGGDKRHRYS